MPKMNKDLILQMTGTLNYLVESVKRVETKLDTISQEQGDLKRNLGKHLGSIKENVMKLPVEAMPEEGIRVLSTLVFFFFLYQIFFFLVSSIVDQTLKRMRYVEKQDSLGPRLYGTNIVPPDNGKSACFRRKMSGLLQLLNINNPNGSIPLSDLIIDGMIIHLNQLARELKRRISIEHPHIFHWTQIPPVDKALYLKTLEDLAHNAGMDIGLCKRSWCANMLLGRAFKTAKQTDVRRTRRAAEEAEVHTR